MTMKHVLAAVLGVPFAASLAIAQEAAPEEAGTGEMAMEEGMTSEGGGDSMVLGAGKIGWGGALGIGMDKAAAGDIMGLQVGGAYGVMENLQAGVILDFQLKHPVDDAALQGAQIGGQFQVMPFVAPTAELNIVRVAFQNPVTMGIDTENKIFLGLSAPIKYVVSDAFAIQALHDVMLRPGGPGGIIGTPLLYLSNLEGNKKGLALAAGALVMPNGPFTAGVDLAYVLPDFKSDFKSLPLVVHGAYDVGMMDIGLAFGFDNLTPPDVPMVPTPGAADARYLSLFARGEM